MPDFQFGVVLLAMDNPEHNPKFSIQGNACLYGCIKVAFRKQSKQGHTSEEVALQRTTHILHMLHTNNVR